MSPSTSASRKTAAEPSDPATVPPASEQRGTPAPTPEGAARPPIVKSEDWVAAWLGLAIIGLVLAGVKPDLPKFKWATDAAVASTVAEKKPTVVALAADAVAAGEQQLATAAVSLTAAVESGDRTAIGKAAREVGEAAKTAKDGALKKKAAELGRELRGSGRLPRRRVSRRRTW